VIEEVPVVSTILQSVGLILVLAAGVYASVLVGSLAFIALYLASEAGKAGR